MWDVRGQSRQNLAAKICLVQGREKGDSRGKGKGWHGAGCAAPK